MEYKIKVNITLKDYKSFIYDNILQKKLSLIISLFLIITGFIFTVVNFILTKKISTYMEIFIFIILVIIFLIIQIPRRLSKIYNSDSTLHEGYLLTISETTIMDESERGSVIYKAEEFNSIIFGKEIIAMYISQQKAVLIPRHCFSSKEEEAEIERFLKANYMKK